MRAVPHRSISCSRRAPFCFKTPLFLTTDVFVVVVVVVVVLLTRWLRDGRRLELCCVVLCCGVVASSWEQRGRQAIDVLIDDLERLYIS